MQWKPGRGEGKLEKWGYMKGEGTVVCRRAWECGRRGLEPREIRRENGGGTRMFLLRVKRTVKWEWPL